MATRTWRSITCPVCETVLNLEIPERADDGTEIYHLPAHVPWLNVNLCIALEVKVVIGPVRDPIPRELVPGMHREHDPRRRI